MSAARATALFAGLLVVGCALDRTGLHRDDAGGGDAQVSADARADAPGDGSAPPDDAPSFDASEEVTAGDAGEDAAVEPDAGTDAFVCTPLAEACNARDDDCDGAIDQGSVCDPCVRHERDGHVYLFCVDAVSWTTARARCVEHGYDLVVVDDAGEQDWLWSIGGPLSGDEYFIGLTDAAAEGEFVWVDGRLARSAGGDLLFTAWKSTAPDNNGAGGEHCVELDRGASGRWEDVPCDQLQSFICELAP